MIPLRTLNISNTTLYTTPTYVGTKPLLKLNSIQPCIINIYYDNEFCSLSCTTINDSIKLQMLQGGIAKAQLASYKDENNNIFLQLQDTTGAGLSAIFQIEGNIHTSNWSSLPSTEDITITNLYAHRTSAVYSGNSAPTSEIGKPGDLYI